MFFNLGPHPPRLWPEDMELLHKLWLDLTHRGLGHKLHPRDVVRAALRKLEMELKSGRAEGIVKELKKESEGHKIGHLSEGSKQEDGGGPNHRKGAA